MAILAEYHRPETLTDALELLAERTSRRVPLAGGTQLVGALETRQRRDVDGVIDLADLDLSYIRHVDSNLRVGAMTTLTELVENPRCSRLASGILPDTTRYEGPQNLRNVATVGGLVALSEPDSELFAALLALGASVVAIDKDRVMSHWQLNDFAVSRRQSSLDPLLITEIQLPLRQAAGGHARIARTPMDRCIVAAVVVTVANGELSQGGRAAGGDGSARTALCGIGPHPLLADSPLVPKGDYKGSAEYRLAMADVVGRRALSAATGVYL